MDTEEEVLQSPPKEDLFRAMPPDFELRGDEDSPLLLGHFGVFDQWTTINSIFEGRFLERIAPGAFQKTFKENRGNMRVLFEHGRDPQVGNKILGPIAELREDEIGGYFESPLFDTSYNRDLIPGLRVGAYGASFRFRVIREDLNRKPEPSDYNPDGLPERTVREAHVAEFGPVTFPAYKGAEVGVRSMTDEFIVRLFTFGEGLEKLAAIAKTIPDQSKKEEGDAPAPAESAHRSAPLLVPTRKRSYLTPERREPWRLGSSPR